MLAKCNIVFQNKLACNFIRSISSLPGYTSGYMINEKNKKKDKNKKKETPIVDAIDDVVDDTLDTINDINNIVHSNNINIHYQKPTSLSYPSSYTSYVEGHKYDNDRDDWGD